MAELKVLEEAFTKGIFETIKGKFPSRLPEMQKYVQQEIVCIFVCSWEAQDYVRKVIRRGDVGAEYDVDCNDMANGVKRVYHNMFIALGTANDNMMQTLVINAGAGNDRSKSFMRCDSAAKAIGDILNIYNVPIAEGNIAKLLSRLPMHISDDLNEPEETRKSLKDISAALKRVDRNNESKSWRLADRGEIISSMDFNSNMATAEKNYNDFTIDLREYM